MVASESACVYGNTTLRKEGTLLVIYGPGCEAERWPKTDVKRLSRTGPNERPRRAQGPVSNFGDRLPQSRVPGFESWGHVAKAGDRRFSDTVTMPTHTRRSNHDSHFVF